MKIKKSLFNPVNLYDDINDLDMMDQMDGFWIDLKYQMIFNLIFDNFIIF